MPAPSPASSLHPPATDAAAGPAPWRQVLNWRLAVTAAGVVRLMPQDRLSQMLTALGQDRERFSTWVRGTPDAAPAQGLERREASGPMEAMRSAHHGTVVAEKSAAVEFF